MNLTKKRLLICLVFTLFAALAKTSNAKTTITFDDLWIKIKDSSPEIKQSQYDFEAANVAHNRSKRHYLPQAQINARGMTTNDAGTTLFSNLGERAVSAGDFNPIALNDPGFGNFSKASLSVNLPLYQGGMNIANKNAASHVKLAKSYISKFSSDFQYANSVTEYALLLSTHRYVNLLANLNSELNSFLKNYELDSSKNPVGRSGQLGLKALSNRLKANIKQAAASINSFKISLSEKSGMTPEGWSPRYEDPSQFLTKKFGRISYKDKMQKIPSSAKATQYYAKAMKEYSAIEKSHLLPHLGLFGQTDVNMGSRDLGSATTLGAYMQWNILAPTQYGASKEKQLQASALQSQAESQILKAKIDYQQSKESVIATSHNLKLMRENLSLLSEQTATANELYQNGAINILQVVDSLNRRADLLSQIYQAESALCLDSAKNYLQGASGE